jgi:hypothetical protein
VKRRTVLLAVAVVAAATASTSGTAGFSGATVERGVSVTVADDDEAFLGIDREATNVSEGRTDLDVDLTNRLPGVADLVVTVSVVGDEPEGGDDDSGGGESNDGGEDDGDDGDGDEEGVPDDEVDGSDDGGDDREDDGSIGGPWTVRLGPGKTDRVAVRTVDCDATLRIEAVAGGADPAVRIVANRTVPCP